ncbi:uncharacterized protein LOC130903307 [Diorhabda carinulata]|uniref:uncharacterized protein LOC130903307 n=2 Tax=Diorhabda carinulata TaxID=1163345 RepID=UPI0025A2A192|nr:uncharacterized protein LOC130903307 [Diorhabda carinulata]
MCESENDTCSSRDLDFNVNSPNENLLFNDATLYNHLTSYSSNVPPNDLFSNEPPPSDLHSKLSNWAASRYVRRTVVTHLLHILHPYHNELPLDSRTLLKTPRETKTKSLLNGEYCHFGLVNALKLKLLSVPNISQYSIINISFNVDGLPIYRNGQKHDLWPILALVKNFKSEPFVVGSFLGSGKPNLLSAFLEDFLIELSNLLTTGIEINNNIHEVKVHSFVCDAPARAYLKCVKTHSGYSSCERCDNSGEHLGRVIFKNLPFNKRDNESFRTKIDVSHHHGESPLIALPIDLIYVFSLDYMHLVCLGVMKKLLRIWTGRASRAKMSSTAFQNVSEKIVFLSKCIPVEFNRKGRSLSQLADWKATEFRTFLLYIGPVALYGNVDLAIYEHFLLFHCSIMILISKRHIEKFGVPFARQLLHLFVTHSEKIYGLEFLVYNVHSLLHLADDVENFGPLDNSSAFPFENYLHHLKSLVQSPNKPLQQINRRLKEIEMTVYEKHDSTSPDDEHFCKCELSHFLGPTPNFSCKQYKKLHYKDFIFSIASYSEANCFCLTLEGLVFKIENIVVDNNGAVFILGRRFQDYRSFYKYPVDSKEFYVYRIQNLSEYIELLHCHKVFSKCIVFPFKQEWLSFSLLHH